MSPLFAQRGEELGAMIAAVLVGGLCGLTLLTLIGAVILRAAVSLFNKMAGGRRPAIDEPGFGKACGIVLVTLFVNIAVQVGVGVMLAMSQMPVRQAQLVGQIAGLPIGFATMTIMNALLLPTDIGKSLLVTLLNYAIAFIIAIIIAVVVVAVMAALGMAMMAR